MVHLIELMVLYLIQVLTLEQYDLISSLPSHYGVWSKLPQKVEPLEQI